MKYLRTLYISENKLKYLLELFGNLPNMSFLFFDIHDFKSLPFSLKKLKYDENIPFIPLYKPKLPRYFKNKR